MQTLISIFAKFAWSMFRETWVILFGFLCGGLCVAAYEKLDFFEAMSAILHDASLIYFGAIIGALALHFGSVLRDRLRSRQELVEQHYAAAIDGQVFFRAVLHVPREWLQLPAEEERRRARAQLKGQGPF
jgi:hypothetical protein